MLREWAYQKALTQPIAPALILRAFRAVKSVYKKEFLIVH